MPTYKVLYRDLNKKLHRERIEAVSEDAAQRMIINQGGVPLGITQVRDSKVIRPLLDILTGRKPISLSLRLGASMEERALLCELMKALESSGVPMAEILQLAREQTGNPWLAKRLGIVVERLQEGDNISTAMGHPDCRAAFPPLMRETIRTGEENGNLEKSLERLAAYYKRASDTKRKIISALTYPIIAFLVFIVVCTIIAIMVPDALEEVVGKHDMEALLKDPRFPGAIRLLFVLRRNPGYLAIPPVAIAGLTLLWGLGKQRRFPATRTALTRVERKVPLIGSILYQFALSSFLDLLAANEANGIPIVESLDLIRNSVGDALIENSLTRMRYRLQNSGVQLGDAMHEPEEIKVFPSLVRQMVRAGEKSGRMEQMLKPIVEYIASQAEATLTRCLDMLTPAMIILLGGVIGPVVLGVYRALLLLNQVAAGGSIENLF